MKLWPELPPLGWLAGVAGAMIVTFSLQPEDPGSVLPVTSDQDWNNIRSEAEELPLPPLSDAKAASRVMDERPLLAEGRRSFVPEPVSAEPPVVPEPVPKPTEPAPEIPIEPPEIEFLGTMNDSKESRALIKVKNIDTELWITTGESIDGWKIVDIETESIILQQKDEKITLYLFNNALP